MKSIVSIFMSIILLSGGIFCNDMEELSKIPSLVSHYQDHQQQEEEGFDFIDFLILHYATDHQQSSDNPDLPFYHHHCLPLAFTTMPALAVDLAAPATGTIHHSIYSVNFPEETVHSFLKPPKA